MGKYLKITPPKRGSKITVAKNGQLQVPDDPIVPFIQGDGIDAEIWKPAQEVFDLAVERCYANAKRLEWLEVYAGEKGNEVYGPNNRLPEDTVRAIQEYKVCIKGPLTTPVGSPVNLDDSLRERLDLFAHVQPIRYIEGVPSPMRNPHGVDLLVFREHTEDVFSEIEWKKGSPEAKQLIGFLNEDLAKKLDKTVRPDSSLCVKPISATATKRLIRLAIEYAVKHKRDSVTFVHKGSIMRHTEGFFRDWGYELARKEFGEYTVTEQRGEGRPRRRAAARQGDHPRSLRGLHAPGAPDRPQLPRRHRDHEPQRRPGRGDRLSRPSGRSASRRTRSSAPRRRSSRAPTTGCPTRTWRISTPRRCCSAA